MYGGIILSDPAPVELKRRAARGRSGREGRGICGRAEGRSEENYGVSVQLRQCQYWKKKPHTCREASRGSTVRTASGVRRPIAAAELLRTTFEASIFYQWYCKESNWKE